MNINSARNKFFLGYSRSTPRLKTILHVFLFLYFYKNGIKGSLDIPGWYRYACPGTTVAEVAMCQVVFVGIYRVGRVCE